MVDINLGEPIEVAAHGMNAYRYHDKHCVHSKYGHDDRIIFMNGVHREIGLIYMIRFDNKRNEFRYLVAINGGGSQWVYGCDIVCKTKY
jgi:hypothetical protein